MNIKPILISAALVSAVALTVIAQAPPPPAAGAAGAAAGGASGRGGRGGGRGNPSAALYTEQCGGCHGTDLNGGRAHSLFTSSWLNGVTDDYIVSTITKGLPGTEMAGFAANMTEQQIWSMVLYLHSQSSSLTPKPVYVPDMAGVVISSEKQKFRMDVLTKDVETPWGMAFLPDGRLLVTERPGRLRILDLKTGKLSDAVKNTPKPWVQQDGGYLDVTVHPNYAQNGWIYMSYSEVLPGWTPPPPAEAPPADPNAAPAGGGGGGRGRGGPLPPANTTIVRGKINKDNEWVEQQVIFRSPLDSFVGSGVHFGSRFAWDKQGHLFFSLGERGTMTNAQDLTKTLGKIHRINDDGTVPKDNPFVNTPGAIASIWSWGHRNPQGLAWDPVTGALWESEHGPTGGDEINIIKPGHNYGWGIATKGTQGGITKTSEPGMDDPIVYYNPSVAPSGIAFYTGDKYPGWKNSSLFVGCLIGNQLKRLEVSGEKVTHQEIVFGQFGRVHDVVQGPDGYFYLAIQSPTGVNGISMAASTPGEIVRLMPVQ